MQRDAAQALVRAHRSLAAQGYGLLIHDAYRPWRVTKMFWEAVPESAKIFVADPSKGSKHNRGCAVDLTLYDLATGKPVKMVGGYDEFSPRSFPDYPGGTSLERWHRELLRRAMEAQGFTVYRVRVVALRPSRLVELSDPELAVRRDSLSFWNPASSRTGARNPSTRSRSACRSPPLAARTRATSTALGQPLAQFLEALGRCGAPL